MSTHTLAHLLDQLDRVRDGLIRNGDRIEHDPGADADAARAALYDAEASLWRAVESAPHAAWNDAPPGARATLARRAAHRAAQCAEGSAHRWVPR